MFDMILINLLITIETRWMLLVCSEWIVIVVIGQGSYPVGGTRLSFQRIMRSKVFGAVNRARTGVGAWGCIHLLLGVNIHRC